MSRTKRYIFLSVLSCTSYYWIENSAAMTSSKTSKSLTQSRLQAEAKACAAQSTIHRQKRHFSPTVFHTPIVKSGGGCRLVDENRKTLAKVPCDFKKHCDMQGVCFLQKGNRLVGFNFIKRKNNTSIYVEVDSSRCPYGYGVWSKKHKRSICMDPYRSIAADNSYHAPGTVLFFPALKGLQLPDHSVHDGYMVVRSTGGAIKGRDRFDFYTGLCTNPGVKSMLCKNHVFTQSLVSQGFGQSLRLKNKDKCFYSYYKVPESLKKVVLAKRNYPDLPQLEVLMAHSQMQNLSAAKSGQGLNYILNSSSALPETALKSAAIKESSL